MGNLAVAADAYYPTDRPIANVSAHQMPELQRLSLHSGEPAGNIEACQSFVEEFSTLQCSTHFSYASYSL